MNATEHRNKKAFDIMHSAFLRMRETIADKSLDDLVDVLLEKLPRPKEITPSVWRNVGYQYRRYARQLPPLYRAEVSPARNTDPDTAQIAALIDKSLRAKQRVDVLFALCDCDSVGATDFELSERCKLLRTSAGKRRKELVDVGLAEKTENRRTTDTDSPAVVWRVTKLGRKTVEQIKARQN